MWASVFLCRLLILNHKSKIQLLENEFAIILALKPAKSCMDLVLSYFEGFKIKTELFPWILPIVHFANLIKDNGSTFFIEKGGESIIYPQERIL